MHFATLVLLMTLTGLFDHYEATRQALLKGNLKDVQTHAAALAATAKKHTAVAKSADAVAKSADLTKARDAFATLSDEMIKLRASATGAKPAVYHCSMVKKSWLQQKGEVGNPYAPGMAKCGELKEE